MNLHSKICLHTHPYVVVHLKSEKDKYLGTNGVYIRVDMEIYLQHGLQQKCARKEAEGNLPAAVGDALYAGNNRVTSNPFELIACMIVPL